KDPADVHCGGRVPRAQLLPLPSLRSVQWLQPALFPLESPPPFPSAGYSQKTYSPIQQQPERKAFFLSGCFILETYRTAPFSMSGISRHIYLLLIRDSLLWTTRINFIRN